MSIESCMKPQSQLPNCNNVWTCWLPCVDKAIWHKTWSQDAHGWQLGLLKSMHDNEVQQGQHPLIKVLKDNVGNDGDKVVKELISTLTTSITHINNMLFGEHVSMNMSEWWAKENIIYSIFHTSIKYFIKYSYT